MLKVNIKQSNLMKILFMYWYLKTFNHQSKSIFKINYLKDNEAMVNTFTRIEYVTKKTCGFVIT